MAALFAEAARRIDAPPPDGAYHVVIVPQDEPARAASYDSRDAMLLALIAAKSGPKSQVFVFRGAALQLTRGADFIIEHGQAHPLFATPDGAAAEADASGFIGSEFVPPSAAAAAFEPADNTDAFGQPEEADVFGEDG